MNNTTLDRNGARMIGMAAALIAVAAGVSLISLGKAHAATGPVISAISSTTTDTGASISWTTDVNSSTQVVFGTSLPYSATSTLNPVPTTSHTLTLLQLLPATLYHFAVLSTDASNTTATSSDNTFTTKSTSTTTTTTASVTLGTTSGAPGTLVTVTGSGFTASEPVVLMWNGATSTTLTASASGGFSTTLTVPSVSVGPLALSAKGVTSGMNATSTFSVTAGAITGSLTGTLSDTTGTTTDMMAAMHNEIAQLESRVSTLESKVSSLQSQVSMLQSQVAMLMNGQTATSTSSVPLGPPLIDQNSGRTVRVGSNTDFTGRNFGHEETVSVTLNGQTITTAHADSGGNFSTGSLSVPATLGSYTYQFTGQSSGRTASATLTVIP